MAMSRAQISRPIFGAASPHLNLPYTLYLMPPPLLCSTWRLPTAMSRVRSLGISGFGAART